jgi:Tfp pilus assembly protein PilF
MGKPGDAVRSYEKALAIEPNHALALVNLGHARFRLGELDAAEASYRKALEILGDDGEVSNNLAAICYARSRPEEALPHLRKALELGFAVHPLFIEEIEKSTGERLKDVP